MVERSGCWWSWSVIGGWWWLVESGGIVVGSRGQLALHLADHFLHSSDFRVFLLQQLFFGALLLLLVVGNVMKLDKGKATISLSHATTLYNNFISYRGAPSSTAAIGYFSYQKKKSSFQGKILTFPPTYSTIAT